MGFLRLTLREWRLRIASPRLWAAWALTSGLFALAAPFGLGEAFGPVDRLVYWLVALGASWALGTLAGAATDTAMAPSGASPLSTLAVTVAASAPFVALILGGLRAGVLNLPYGFGAWFASLPVYAALTLLLAAKSRIVTGRPLGVPALDRVGPLPAAAPIRGPGPAGSARGEEPTATARDAVVPETGPRSPAPAFEEPAAEEIPVDPQLLQRLPAAKRAPLLRLTMNDHYVSVATEAGEDLLLMRLGDAMAEAWPEEGLRVHRSHWVARRAVRAVRRDGDRATLTLANGEEIPVSRARLRELRAAGWLDDPRPAAPAPRRHARDGAERPHAQQAAAMANRPDRVTGRSDTRDGG